MSAFNFADGEDAIESRQTFMFDFFARTADQSPNRCWEWTGAVTSTTGYGRLVRDGKGIDTHRVSWMLTHGDIPEGMDICHTCDNRRCINPAHLFLGTRSDNMRDAREKGRIFGQKLTRSDVDQIKSMRAAGMTQRQIAQIHGVSRSTVGDIMRGKSWAA